MDEQKYADELTADMVEETAGQSEENSVDQSKELVLEKERYMRLYAEFDNFRRRTAREHATAVKLAAERVVGKLIPVVDDFERALSMLSTDLPHEEAMRKGIALIYDKLLAVLHKEGVEVMHIQVGDAFDAEKHEAIAQASAPSAELQGRVVEVVDKGYMLGGRVVRFAKVVIGA